MATFLAEVCLNSYPLQALTDDPENLDALTPGHFLIGTQLNAVPEPSLLDIPGLTSRPKWWTAPGNLQEGQLCLFKAETTSPCRWPLARITRLYPGEDEQVRVVDVRTSNGELTKRVVKVVPLPTADVADLEAHEHA
ncbi:hypothetical protein RF55_13720 [Lasius niger]|uniref:DUF5641 domain-containing protein n=1 Tax=Lasius niger TaxID=67767 RepID=A0A0J7K745_LASNI|nr:hypothetical protein RF55_14725 [Lasius niger]KMQ87094.1 hypothetical protein RF55_13720 [Lasius niger]